MYYRLAGMSFCFQNGFEQSHAYYLDDAMHAYIITWTHLDCSDTIQAVFYSLILKTSIHDGMAINSIKKEWILSFNTR